MNSQQVIVTVTVPEGTDINHISHFIRFAIIERLAESNPHMITSVNVEII